MRLACVLVVLSAGAWAQGAKPSVMSFPLEFKRVPAAVTKAEREGLTSDAERLLRAAGAQLPDFAKAEQALAELKRQDCEREDACLQQLAQKAETLYALYANVDFTLEGMVVVTGRVVRDDGKLVAPLQTVTLPRGKDKHRDVAKNALVALYELLKVKELPPVREVAQPVVATVEPKKVEPVVVTPPVVTQPGPSEPSPVAKTLVYAGAGVAVAGLAAAIAGAAVGGGAGKLRVGNEGLYATDAEAAANLATGRTLTTVGFVGLGLGAAAAAVGAVLWASTPSSPKVTFVPMAQGGAFVVGGSF